MGRQGVGYSEVAHAAQTIKCQGKNPTVDRVLAYLGTGSKSTIAPFLKQWKAQHELRPVMADELPENLIQVVKALYEEVNLQAEEKVRVAEVQAANKLETLQQQLLESERSTNDLVKESHRLKSQLNGLDLTHQNLLGKFTVTSQTLIKQEAHSDTLTQKIADKIETIKHLRDEMRRTEARFNNFQLLMDEERKRERVTYQTTLDRLEQNQKNQQHQSRLENNRLNDQVGALNKEQKALQIQLEEKSESLRVSREAARAANDKLESLTQEYQALADTFKSASQRLMCLEEALACRDKVIQKNKDLLSAATLEKERTHTARKTLEDKLLSANRQAEVLQLDKAMLAGQIKQLRETLGLIQANIVPETG